MAATIQQMARIAYRSFFPLSLVLIFLASGCGAPSTRGTDDTVPDKVVVGLGDDVPIFSALRPFGGNQSFLKTNVYERLIEVDTELGLIPGLASSWKISSDGKSYEFKLRKGATY